MYKKRKFINSIDKSEQIILCDCCGEYRKVSSITEYIYKNRKYQVCQYGLSMDNKKLHNMFETSNVIKYLLP